MRSFVLLSLCLAVPALAQSGTSYRVTFAATWSAQTHPAMFPPGAHFSPLAGAAHDASAALWAEGETASPGVEQMAETGATSILAAEVAALGTSAGALVRSPAIGSPGSTDVTVSVSGTHPLVSLVTMIAPSPDWFLGVHGLDLRDGAGAWRDQVVVELFAYDAGTDSGTTYTAPDADTQPRAPITRLTSPPFDSAVPLGTLTFDRLAVAGEAGPDGTALAFRIANPARAGATLRVDAPYGEPLVVALFSLDGRRVATLHDGAGGAQSLAMPRLPTGVYALRATSGASTTARLVTVVR